MAEKIKLVQGDELPYIHLELTSELTGQPINVSDPEAIVKVYFRAAGAPEVLSTITCEKVDAANGKVRFNFANGVLDVAPGPYQAEIEVALGDQTQTIYDVLKFVVRPQFA